MKIAVVGTSGGWSSELLAKTVAERTGFHLLVEMDRVRLDLPSGRLLFEDYDLRQLDALIIKKIGQRYSPELLDRLEILRLLPRHGVLLCSDPVRIIRVLDRLSCTLTLQQAKIPMPATSVTEDLDQALQIIREYGEVVLKPLYSTKARGMTVLQDGQSGLLEELQTYKKLNRILYIQQKVDLGNYDLGIVFLGGEYLTTYARCRQGGSWNTTIASGGSYAAVDPDPAIIELARRAQAPFGLDFTCVDMAETAAGPVVFEVSAFGGFRGLQEARGLDVASLYTDYVIRRREEQR
ncbi:MAG: GAK system ATP-grasp enzyme [Deltaproteobacteria bacterium]|nr:GAK system ATP-grasp enzyme [Deltaproteobacteria bacterium]